jgi:HAD domain in Swiss Army Knife RNA repair proteins
MADRIVFLDFDGPIIPMMSHAKRSKSTREKAWPACIAALNRITDTVGAKIVVSSSWRWGGFEHVRDLLRDWGATAEVIDITPILETAWKPENKLWAGVPRGREIGSWLLEHPEVKEFVILDDDTDMENHSARLIQTPFETGLTENHADQAIAMFDPSAC